MCILRRLTNLSNAPSTDGNASPEVVSREIRCVPCRIGLFTTWGGMLTRKTLKLHFCRPADVRQYESEGEYICPCSFSAGRRIETLQQHAEAAVAERNPHEGEADRLQALAEEAAATLEALDDRRADLARLVSTLAELDAGFGRTGMQSFALEGILGELQVRCPTSEAMRNE